MYEHRTERLLTRVEFFFRVIQHGLLALGVVAAALFVGVLGYHFTEGLHWIDALLNASMILGGMGPVDMPKTVGGKTFASLYALFSGLVFIAIMGVLLAPFAHRLMHRFHLESEAGDD